MTVQTEPSLFLGDTGGWGGGGSRSDSDSAEEHQKAFMLGLRLVTSLAVSGSREPFASGLSSSNAVSLVPFFVICICFTLGREKNLETLCASEP